MWANLRLLLFCNSYFWFILLTHVKLHSTHTKDTFKHLPLSCSCLAITQLLCCESYKGSLEEIQVFVRLHIWSTCVMFVCFTYDTTQQGKHNTFLLHNRKGAGGRKSYWTCSFLKHKQWIRRSASHKYSTLVVSTSLPEKRKHQQKTKPKCLPYVTTSRDRISVFLYISLKWKIFTQPLASFV